MMMQLQVDIKKIFQWVVVSMPLLLSLIYFTFGYRAAQQLLPRLGACRFPPCVVADPPDSIVDYFVRYATPSSKLFFILAVAVLVLYAFIPRLAFRGAILILGLLLFWFIFQFLFT